MFFIPQEASTLSVLGQCGKERNGDLAHHIHNELGSLDETPTHLDKKQNTKQSEHQSLLHNTKGQQPFLGHKVSRSCEGQLSGSWDIPPKSV